MATKLTFSSILLRAEAFVALPGSAFLIWYAVLVCIGFFNAYVYVFNAPLIFVLGFAFVPIIIVIFVVIPPVWAILKSTRSLLQRNYRSAAAFGLVPAIGFGWLILSSKLFISMMMAAKIVSYQSSIETARANGKMSPKKMSRLSSDRPPWHVLFSRR